MNLARLLPAVLLLTAGLPAHAELGRSAPPSQSTPTLSTNYRLTLSAKSGDKALGEITLLTCAPAIDASGFLEKPAEATLPAATLTLRGRIAEQEGGTLLVTYTLDLSTPLVSQTVLPPLKRTEAEAKAADAKPETRNVSSFISYREHYANGALRMQPGKSYELMTMAGTVYSLTLSPEPQK